MARFDPPFKSGFLDKETGNITEPWAHWFIENKRDIYNWIAAGDGITVTDDGDGTITLAVKNQSNVSDATTDHAAVGDPATKTALDALGVKINEILSLLQSAEIMDP